MLSPRPHRSSDIKDFENLWLVSDRSVSPIDQLKYDEKLSISQPKHQRQPSAGDNDETERLHLDVPSVKVDAVDGHQGHRVRDEDLEYCKPVRRGVGLSQEIHDEYLICKICLENYKNPKCLDCMHTFCEECIENHVHSESSYKKYSDYREFTCPLCRKRTQLPLGGVRKLPDNHLIDGVMKAVAKRRPLSSIDSFIFCDICRTPISYFRSSKSASPFPSSTTLVDPESSLGMIQILQPTGRAARCLDCCKVMCAGCTAAHKRTAVTRSHSVYDPDIVADVMKDQNALACREHCNETVEYYCMDCRRCVCMLCAFDEQAVEPHVNHDIVDFHTAATRHQSSLRQLCDGATSKVTRLEARLTELTACADHIDTIRRQIIAAAESFRQLIDSEEKALLDRLDALYGCGMTDGRRGILDDGRGGRAAAAAMRENVGKLDAVRQLAETIAERGGVELLLLHDEVAERLKREQQQLQQSDGGSPSPLSGTDDDVIRKRLQFVPGVVNLGRLDVLAAGSKPESGLKPTGSCSTCNRLPVQPLHETSTMTEQGTAMMQDKAVNTRARGLLHNGGGNTGGPRVAAGSGSRSASVDTEQINEDC